MGDRALLEPAALGGFRICFAPIRIGVPATLMFWQPLLTGALAGLASTAHCAAMCGPLTGALCGKERPSGTLARYQMGRMTGYAVAGAIAGGVGEAIALSSLAPTTRLLLPALTALALLVLALRVWRGNGAPRGTSNAALVQLRTGARAGTPSTLPTGRAAFGTLLRLVPREPSVLGLLSALLPCGALFAALLLAASTGQRGAGAALMLAFATTTAIGALTGGIALSRLSRWAQRHGRFAPRAVAIALACAALFIGLQPLYARGPHFSSAEQSAPACH